VSKSIAKGVLEEEPFERQSGLFALAMFSVLVAATVTTLIATVYGYPISATHSIIGGLIATGLAAKGSDGLNGGGIAKTCIAWILSPLLGGLVAGVLYWLITKYVFLAKNPGLAADKAQYALFALTVSVALSFILCKGRCRFDQFSLTIVKIGLADHGRPAPAAHLGDCCGLPSPTR
jgi:phosphate/sulfate permease